MKKTIFVTGTDTGVGKTLFTALLLHYLRAVGCRALAMKPFCSGGRGDVELLQSLQPGELSDAEMNPFYFEEPVAPLIAKEAKHKKTRLKAVLAAIKKVQAKCDVLVIEGSGGLLVPLGKGFTVLDLIAALENCQTVIVARNQLGTINHTWLTVNALQATGIQLLAVALMAVEKPDQSSPTNGALIADLIGINVLEIPFLGKNAARTAVVRKNSEGTKAIAQVVRAGSLV